MNEALKRKAARHYPHRIEADPGSCPVCCGDRRTTDPAFGGKVLYKIESIGTTVRECLLCQEGTT